jgi:hypothetical protein
MKTLELKKYKEPVPTDKPTEKVSESETIASTDAETDVTADGGCNATISLGVILFTCVGVAAVIKRKRVE